MAPLYPTRLVKTWPDFVAASDTLMIALHARRSASSIAAWRAHHGTAPLAVVLTGTDLYRDIRTDPAAQDALMDADALVVLQDRAPLALPPEQRGKTRVIFQSATRRALPAKTSRHLKAVMVGHLREEKSPATLYAAARMLAPDAGICIDQVGGPQNQALADEATALMAACPRYRWLGNRPHAETRRRIQHAHVLVHCSRIEGGAQVIIEAAMSGTPVLASRIDGNVGLLGEDYGGYFEWGDAEQLVRLLRDCRETQDSPGGLLHRLARQVATRTHLFLPRTERQAVRHLVADLLRLSA